MDPDPRFPLGTPVNRPEPKKPQPIAGRPDWWRDATGIERFIAPEAKKLPQSKG